MEQPMETMNAKNQVLIVGAGPTGLMAAAQLLRWGIKPRIIEANAAPTLQTRAIGVQARSMEIYRQMGLESAVFSRGVPAKAATIFTEQGRLGEIELATVGAGLSAYPYMFILGQDQNERVLNDDLRCHGLEVEWKTAFKELQPTVNGVSVTLETPNGCETIEYRYVLGADGASSRVRKALQIDFVGKTNEHKLFVADLRAEGNLISGQLNIFINNKYYAFGLFPMKGAQRFRLVGMLPDELVGRENLKFDDLQPILKKVVGKRIQFSDASWFSTYNVHHRVALQFKKGNCFLLGDAAHVHSPVGGQGMNTGLQDAYNLAWKLALVLSGQAKEHLLETYHDERHPNAISLINTTDQGFNIIVSRNPVIAFARKWLLPRIAPPFFKFKSVQRRFFLTVSQTAINYRNRKLSIGHLEGSVKAGDRFPWFIDNGQDVFQQMTGTRFTLFALGNWKTQQLEGLRSSLLESIIISNRAAYTPTGLVDGLYLVRPDGYIGLCTKDLNEVRTYLTRSIGLNGLFVQSDLHGLNPENLK
jgi:2-polyprenyl-6-methoxyphenol hydroxylase-like FAD-dependent oxidoreductase